MPVCLPSIDVPWFCGLGTATVAGVPALGSAAPKSDAKLLPDDPVFQAIAALEQLKIHAEEQEAAYEIAEAAVFRARDENCVTLGGEEMRTHEQIDAHFTRRTSLPISNSRGLHLVCLPPSRS
jgi:hypothetical protein